MPNPQSPLTLYFKSPYLRQIKQGKTPYILRIEPYLVQFENQIINLSDNRLTIPVFITSVKRVLVSDLDEEVVKSLGFKGRGIIGLIMQNLYNLDHEVREVTLMRVVVQPKKRTISLKRRLYTMYGLKVDTKPQTRKKS